jgi:GNAT superfamily N-acetyltransferase
MGGSTTSGMPAVRGRGVASALIDDLVGRAAVLGVHGLYLYTNGAEDLYRKLGWSDLAREPYMGRDVTIMARTISPSPG